MEDDPLRYTARGAFRSTRRSHKETYCDLYFYAAKMTLLLILPKEIACFSYDDNHEFHLDDSSLKYYYTPQLGVSLCAVCEDLLLQRSVVPLITT